MEKIEIVDTTTRDGEQTKGVSFNRREKLSIIQNLLKKVKVSRCEVASALTGIEEQKTLKEIMAWAIKNGFEDKIEVLSFVDFDGSISWIEPTGCQRINLLTKGSKLHCEKQLGKTTKEHIADVIKTVEYAKSKGFTVNLYLEDWSSGMRDSPEYVDEVLNAYRNIDVERIILPDTLGILNPFEILTEVSKVVENFPEIDFEFHAHNDYGMATANTVAAIKAGVKGVHVTVNSLGERAGNADLSQVVVAIKDHLKMGTGVDETKLIEMSKIVETFSSKRVPSNMPIVGSNVFTQAAGVHADGDNKGNLYISILNPKRFGRNTDYALGKLSGKANVEKTLKILNISLGEAQKAILLKEIKALSEKGKNITIYDIPFMISDLFEKQEYKKFKVLSYSVTSTTDMKAVANIKVEFEGKIYEKASFGTGGYDAFMIALGKIFRGIKFKLPSLVDYEVVIPPGGDTNSLTETNITWDNGFVTHALSSDQVEGAIKATERLVNLICAKVL